MKYMGSKGRHAAEFLPIILRGRGERPYVEPFVGGCNVIDKVAGQRIGGDINPHLMTMWHEASMGWLPPRSVSEEDYSQAQRERIVCARTGYIGTALSYGGKWFGGYRRDAIGKRDYADEAYRSAIKQFPKIAGVKFYTCAYDELPIPDDSIVYCDPPYRDSTGYQGKFDSDRFWDWCGWLASKKDVFVSEYSAPAGWECVWEKSVNNTLVKDTGAKRGIERLWHIWR